MKTKINIAEILRNKPHGVKLYSPIFGDCTYYYVREDTNDICVKKYNSVKEYFNSEGLYFALGEVMLFPSREMHDWFKLDWKRGDALSCGVDNLCIFEKWANKEYTEFYAKFVTPNYSGNTFKTEKWSKETNEAVIKQYISNIEEFKGGKLNLTTLEIEKTQPEFKDGDIVTIINGCEQRCILIFRNIIGDSLNRYCILTKRGLFTEGYSLIDKEDSLLFATEEEKNKLFSALEKEGKAWDSEKKQIVDLKPKVEFKPMDLCLMKYIGQYNNRGWELCQYAYTEHRVSSSGEQRDFYHAVGGEIYAECIPYNEDTKHLLGTRDKWKGGEG